MWIRSIQVVKLYGLHNYEITFKEEEKLKIIHAPNGFGKTTILRLVRAMIEGCLKELKEIPFERFKIAFDQRYVIEALKVQGHFSYRITDEKGMKTYNIEQEMEREGLLEAIKILQQEIPVYFIDADRLWIEEETGREEERTLFPTALEYARELSQWMREALAQSNFCGQELDRSFPMRILQLIGDNKVQCQTPEALKKALEALEEKRHILEDAGLFAAIPQPIVEHFETLSEEMRKVMMLYIQDSTEKLKAFEVLANKINMLCHLINKRFSYKVMEVNVKEGFVFRVPTHEKLRADKLSSGEQNELVLMFMLLFKAPPKSLILMDEPEISLHIAWQQSFLEDMACLSNLSDIRMIIATHSPDIINGRWDLTSALEENT